MQDKIKILHLIADDKFLDAAMAMFDEALPNGNEYVVWNRSCESDIKYIKAVRKISSYAPWGSENAHALVGQCRARSFDAILLHSWPNWRYVKELKSSGLPVFLFTWGHEIYGFIRQRDFLPCTQKAMRDTTPLLKKIRQFASRVKKILLVRNRDLKEFLTVDFICPVIEDDYFRLKAKYGNALCAKMMPFSYGCGCDSLLAATAPEKTGAIVVGNAETWTNNHIDVFHWLKRLGIENEVIVPISYGNNPVVKKAVLDSGKELLGAHFSPLTEFLPYPEYWRRIGAASYSVMGHLRQQGLGNVVIALALGMKVFLFRASPVSQFLKRNGFVVGTIDETNTASEFLAPMTAEEVENNKKLLLRIWGHDAIAAKIGAIINAIVERKKAR